METLSINIDDCADKNNTSNTTVLNKIIIKIIVAFWRYWVIRDVIVINVRVKKPPKSQQYLLAFVG
jgi:hypothetical protein